MSNDSDQFRSRDELDAGGWRLDGNVFRRKEAGGRVREHLPLYEAKMVHHFDHRWATYENGRTRDATITEKQNPDWAVLPRYWVDAREVYLRTAALPKGLLDALRNDDEEAIVSGVAHLLFAQHLRDKFGESTGRGLQAVSASWTAFASRHRFADAVPPETDPAGVSARLQFAADHAHLAEHARSAPPLGDTAAAVAWAENLLERASPRWLMGWRDICRSTDERTLINGVVPRAAVSNKFVLIDVHSGIVPSDRRLAAVLLGSLGSLACDFAARQKMGGTTLNYFIMKQFAVLPSDRFTETDFSFIVPRVLELTYTAWDLQPFAHDCGWDGPPFRWDEERRFLLRAELDAAFFHLYLPAASDGGWKPARTADGAPGDETAEQLAALRAHFPTPRDAVAYILETFTIVKRRDVEQHGEYRTANVILAIYDAMQEAASRGGAYRSRIDPPPADRRCCHPEREPSP